MWTLKMDEAGNAVARDGKPVFITGDGKEVDYDVNQARNKIKSLCEESKKHRETAEGVIAKLKAFEGIDNPQEALKALETCRSLDDKKLIDAGEVERLKAEFTKASSAKLAELQKSYDELQKQYYDSTIGSSFATSSYIAQNLNIPPDMAKAFFGNHFQIDADGKTIAKDGKGNVIYSQTNLGEQAGFEEAIEILVNNYPHRDSILRSNQASGGGIGGTPSTRSALPASFADCKTEEQQIAFLKANVK